jgi:hypothetical protein
MKGLSDRSTLHAFSYSLWFFNKGDFTSYAALADNPTAFFARSTGIYLGPDANSIYVAFRAQVGGVCSTPRTMQLNRWHHLAVTVSEAGLIQPWLDGEKCGTQTAGPYYEETEIHISANSSGGATGFTGLQDDIGIYERALSDNEIGALASQRGAWALTRRRRPLAVAGIVARTAEDSISFSNTVSYTLVTTGPSKLTEDTLALINTASFFLISEAYQITDTMLLVSTATTKGFGANTDMLALSDAADFRLGLPPAGFFLTDTLGLFDSCNRGQVYSIVDNLNLIDYGDSIIPVFDTLVLTQTITFSYSQDVQDAISFAQTIVSESRFGRPVFHTNILQQAVGYYVIGVGKCGKAKYSQFEGSGADSGIPSKPMSSNHIPVAFESMTGSPYPVYIRAPEMDDKHRMSFDRVNRETLGGDLSVYRDSVWPVTQAMLFTIVGIKTTIFESLRTFMLATLGQEVLFHDWTGVAWRGIVTNPEETATEDRDGYWTVAFEFEGETYDGPPSNHSLAFTDTASFTIV